MHRLNKEGSNTLRVDITDDLMIQLMPSTLYLVFGNSASKYTLTVGGYNGIAGDSLAYHNGKKFSTRDQDNDGIKAYCAITSEGAWWFEQCYHLHLNGQYNPSPCDAQRTRIYWCDWKGDYDTLTFTEMKIRHNNQM